MKNFGVIFLMLIFIMNKSCSQTLNTGNNDKDNKKIEGNSDNSSIDGLWILESITGSSIGVLKGTYIQINGNSFYLNAGCNSINGVISKSKSNSISFKIGMSTMMACDNMKYESDFSTLLSEAKSYTNTTNLLTLSTKDNVIITFKKQLAKDHIIGKTWKVNGLTINNGVHYDADAPLQTITFSKDGKISGNSGCNTFFGDYEIKDNLLYLSKVGTTLMMCEDKVINEYESNFLNYLQVSPISIEDSPNNITFRDENGRILMSLQEK